MGRADGGGPDRARPANPARRRARRSPHAARARRSRRFALGLVGKFWRPAIEYAQVSAADFRDVAEPSYAKTVYELAARPLEEGTLLSGLMRTATTDEHARRWFRRYWTFGVGSGAHMLVHALLESVRASEPSTHRIRDERRASTASRGGSLARGWVGGAVLGIANGVAREATLSKRFDERTAHQLSTLRDRRFRGLLRAPAATLAAGEHARGAFGRRCLAGVDDRLRVRLRPPCREAVVVRPRRRLQPGERPHVAARPGLDRDRPRCDGKGCALERA